MTGPRIAPRISLGNIISLAGSVMSAIVMLAALVMWGGPDSPPPLELTAEQVDDLTERQY